MKSFHYDFRESGLCGKVLTMNFQNVNLNNLRVFEAVFRAKCMTTASKELHLTQSGVSQHIKNLENTLEVSLFDRVNKSLLPTEEGTKLYEQVKQGLGILADSISTISQKEMEVEGLVRIGMPVEFGINLVIPELVKIGEKYPGLKYKINLGYAKDMNDLLLNGDLDVAIVDTYKMDNKIEVKKLTEETLHMCCTENYLKKRKLKPVLNKKFFESLNYVAYQDGEVVLRSWINHHIKRKNLNINATVQVMDVQAVSKVIMKDFAVGALPGAMVKQLQKNGVKVICLPESKKVLTNQLSLTYIKNRSHNLVTQTLIDELLAI